MKSPGTSVKILIVEDNELNADMLRRRLERRSFDVVVAETGAAALAALDAGPFDLVLLDIRLPDISGLELARLIRERRPQLPMIAVTGDALPEILEEAMAAGCAACVTKPVDFQVLMETMLDVALENAKARFREALQTEAGGVTAGSKRPANGRHS